MNLPADIARCDGRTEDHPYYHECLKCLRKLSPPVPNHPWQSWITPWQEAHGPCPDKIRQEKEEV